MFLRYLSIFFLFVSLNDIKAQVLTVASKTTLQGIENVTIYNTDMSLFKVTDKKGRADISAFKDSEAVYFRHPSYQQQVVSYADLEKNNFKITLAERAVPLGEVVIAANRWEEKAREVASQVVTIAPKEIAFANPQTTADVMANTGQVFVQKSQLGGGSPMLRGFAANSVLLVIDGVRMNNAIYRSGNLQNIISVDANSLERAEVLFGPGSVIYGSDALGGVMSFITRKPFLSLEDTTRASGNAFVRYASANHEQTAHADFNIGFKKVGLFTSVTFSDFDDLRAGNIRSPYDPDFGKREEFVMRIDGKDSIVPNSDYNIQRFSGYSQLNLMQKVRFAPSENYDFNYSFFYTTSSNIPRYDRLIEYRKGKPRNAEWYYGPQKWMMHALNTQINKPNTFYTNAKIAAAFQQVEESRHNRKYQDDWLRSQVEKVDVLSLNIDLKKSLAEKHELYYGVEGISNIVGSSAHRENITTGETEKAASRYPDGGSTLNSYAAYMQHHWEVSEKLNITSGARYSRSLLHSEIKDTTVFEFPFKEINNNTDAITGSIGVVYMPTKEWKLNASASSGFRAPNVDDVAKIFDSEPGAVIVPNPGLGPEYSYNAEAGIQKSFNDKVKVGGVAYYSWLIDAHVRRDFTFNGEDSIVYQGVLSRVTANVNAGEAYVFGFSADIQADINDNLSFTSSLTYTEGKDPTAGITLRHVPPVFGRTSIIYRLSRFKGEFFADYNGWKYFRDLPPEEQAKTHLYTAVGTPAWYTLNVRASYQVIKSLQINAALENILDTHYRPFSSGISAPGRNLVVTLRGSF